MADESTDYKPRCINLYSKAMLVFGESFADDPEHQSGMSSCWCLSTSKSYGPDGDEVSLTACCNKERSCFQEY